MTITAGDLAYYIRAKDDHLDGDLRQAEKKAGGFLSNLKSGIFAGIGMAIGNAVLGGLRMAIGAIPEIIGKASDLSETVNKVNTVFGDASGAVTSFAATADKALGQSQQSALDAASTFGIFGNMAGLAGKDLTGFSLDLVGLSSDLASFYNTSPEEAITAIGAALRGEAEPIRKYGVLMDDATLRQVAFEKGIISTTKEALTPQQKVLAAYELIMRQTAVAQGDFAKTSGGLANQQRIFAATVENLKVKIGTGLLPVVNLFMGKITKLVGSDQFQKWVGKLTDGIGKLGAWLIKGGEGVGFLAEVFKNGGFKLLFTTFEDGTSYVGSFLEKLGIAEDVAYGVGNKMADAFRGIYNWLKTNIPLAIETLRGFWEEKLWPALQRVAAWVVSDLVPTLQDIWTWLQTNIPPALERLAEFWEGTLWPALQRVAAWVVSDLVPVLSNIWTWLSTNIPPALQRLAEFWEVTLWPALQRVAAWVVSDLVPVLSDIWTWLQTNIPLAIDWLSTAWTTVLLPALQTVWSWINESLIPTIQTIWDWLQVSIPAAIQWVADKWTWLSDTWNTAVTKINDAINTVKTAIEDKLITPLTNAWNYIDTYILPILREVKDIFDIVLRLAIGAFKGYVENFIVAPLTKVWNYIQDNILPIFEKIATYIETNVVEAMEKLWAVIEEKIMPIFTKVKDFLTGEVDGALEGVNTKFTTLKDTLEEGVKKALEWVYTKLSDLKDLLLKITLPDWLTPGSPTPFEMGLRGIASALQEVSAVELPKLAASLEVTGGARGYAGGVVQRVTYFNQTVNTAATAGQVMQAFGMAKAMARG